jgi:probable HAF family extracellular repeat protein
MVGLGDLPPDGPFDRRANAISADGQVIVGQGLFASGSEAFYWTDASGLVPLGDLPDGRFESGALGVSSNGEVIVGTGESDLGEQAFRWTSASMLALPMLPDGTVPTGAMAVSGDGSVIVGTAHYAGVAFIWDAAHGTRSLQEVLANVYGLDLTGWTLEAAEGISVDGLAIVGVGTNPDGNQEAFLAFVPEPSTGLLLGTALAALALSAILRRGAPGRKQ